MITTEFCSTHTLTMGEVLKMITFHFYTEVSPAMYFQTLPPLAKTAHTFIIFFLIHVTIISQQYAKKEVLLYFLSYFAFLHVCTFLFLWCRCSHPPPYIGTISQCLAQNEWRCRPHRLSHDGRLQQGLPSVCCQLSTPWCLT